jgi:predicted NBD/HSP70 family sugar kinase
MLAAVDIGGTKIAVGAVRDDGTIVTRCECPTDPARGFRHAIELIKQMLHSVSSEDSKFKGIGIACPGPLDPATGIIGNVGPEQCRLSISERARRSDAFSYLITQIYCQALPFAD